MRIASRLLKALDAERWILKEDQRKAVKAMIREFRINSVAFSLKEEPLARINLIEHKIKTGNND